ncbi:MAG: carbohydrate porin [Candidatus Eremiobacteraeota bacterium]|nr:carbohydrate porin [Candidatus Eremiobacteraeota bacterium]
MIRLALFWLVLIVSAAESGRNASAQAIPSASPSPIPQERWNVHVQATNTQYYNGNFSAAYSGAQSLYPLAYTQKTVDVTFFLGARLWKGAAAYLNPEIDQGFGLGNPGPAGSYNGTFGSAGYFSGEAFKVGSFSPYGRMQRYFIRQTFDLVGERQALESDENQLAGSIAADNVILTLGKFSVVDVFDGNAYAHDPKRDFLNWSIIDMGSFDYAADAWGFTWGLSAEYTKGLSTLRGGMFQLSARPNVIAIEKTPLLQWMPILEFERRTSFFGAHPGSIKALVYGDNGYMAPYAQATAGALGTGSPPSFAPNRNAKYWKVGAGINLQQEVAPNVGVFGRLSAMNGTWEAYDYTEIDRSLMGGVSLNGALWHRPFDTVGIAGALNGISRPAQGYYGAGGLGITIGDGGLSYGGEQILEAYYQLGLGKTFAVTGDYQHVVNPGYNTVRGPVSVFALRMHAQL